MSKIAILHPHITIKWWAVKTLLEIAGHLKNVWDEVTFYTLDLNRNNCFPELSQGLSIKNLNAKWFNKIIWLIKLVFLLRKTDIVLAGNSPMHFVWVLAKIIHPSMKVAWFLQNIPVYYMDQNKWIFTSIKKFFEKIIIRYVDLILVNSSFIQDEVKKNFGKESEILYPSIDVDFFSNDHQSLEENNTLFTYSRLSKWKNVELAIKTYAELQKRYPGLKLLIWWDWEEKERLEELAQFFPDIQFLWEINQEEVKSYLQRCTVFLFTSTIDAFGLTILEAMSMEKSIVSLACWWAMELIWNWDNWYLARSEEEFIQYADELLSDPEKRQKMWEIWRKWAIEHFSLSSMYDRVDDLF
ncbi:MAG: glycosyl transferase group 1 [uncultured bacterium (gcode 4)]|uniref:Glycosyl transferase group 1 n=1 Tax=uncultured bacterium (gcode 4) TaxID=1234023 RepID=K2FAN3_9BACT|nr:MAG: glycosyl transferase group 1 [uncultured bacterium (gcode 4)]